MTYQFHQKDELQNLRSENKRLRERIAMFERQQKQKRRTNRASAIADERLEELPILIVGGSDGSGTRGVVDMLQRLKIDMIVQDKYNQGDIHAPQMFQGKGWPPLALLGLQARNGSLLYEFDDMLPWAQRQAELNVKKLLAHLKQSYKMYLPTKYPTLVETNGTSLSNGVSYGFKAPITMLLLPILSHVIGRPIKFVHVLRE
jgi:hypothetical protein